MKQKIINMSNKRSSKKLINQFLGTSLTLFIFIIILLIYRSLKKIKINEVNKVPIARLFIFFNLE